jgi:hypothetical protein
MNSSKRPNEKDERAGVLPKLCLWFLALAVPLSLAVFFARAATSEQIKSTGALKVPRFLHTATLLTNGVHDGRVLIAGGVDATGQKRRNCSTH